MMTSFIKEKCIDTLTITYWYKYKNCPKRGLYRGHLGVTPVYQCIFGSCAWWAKWFQRLEDIFLRLFHRGKKINLFHQYQNPVDWSYLRNHCIHNSQSMIWNLPLRKVHVLILYSGLLSSLCWWSAWRKHVCVCMYLHLGDQAY